MKPVQLLLSLVLVCLIFMNCSSQVQEQNINQQSQNNLEDFAEAVFNSFKNNDFNSYINLLPSPPFTLGLKSLGQGKDDMTISAESFAEWKSNYHNQFNSIISALKAEGVILSDMKLDKIIAEFDGDVKFQVVEIYLILRTAKGNYKIRIEDCFKVGNKYLPEQLKWQGKNI